MKSFSISKWLSGELDFESKYYIFLSFLQKTIEKEKYKTIKELKNTIIELHNEELKYDNNKIKYDLILLGKYYCVEILDNINNEKNNVFDFSKNYLKIFGNSSTASVGNGTLDVTK